VTVRIICAGLAGIALHGGNRVPVGAFLKSYDPEAHDGQGWAKWTTDPDDALLLADAVAAMQLWQTVPASRPVRPDGKPNRPLAAFTISIEDWPPAGNQ
jgi:hypothetical protein